MPPRPLLAAPLLLPLLVACGLLRITTRTRAAEAAAPPRDRGCSVAVLSSAPPGATELGWSQVDCDSTVPAPECWRALFDEACALGADSVWEVQDISKVRGRSKLVAHAGRMKTSTSP